jgi:ubiquinone/menaquinone biosynthesis C-methylase UbiE
MASKFKYGLALTALLSACSNWTGFGFDARGPEMQRIRETLPVKEGMTIADVGAGKGELSAALAREVGARGKVYATDVDAGRDKALKGKLGAQVVVVEGGIGDARLPPGCCDAIVLRRVYHHLTELPGMNASLLRALRPGGVLAVIDFPPPFFLGRGDYGVPAKDVIGEVTGSGFELVRRIDDWPGRGPLGSYCVLFRKPR